MAASTLTLPDLYDANTLGAMAARVSRWARERVDPDILNDAINDATESLWMTAQLATLSKFARGVVTQSMVTGQTALNLISVSDPTIPLVTGAVAGGALPARQEIYTYTFVTDSGTETLPAPASVVNCAANTLTTLTPPVPNDPTQSRDCVGWNVYGGPGADPILLSPTPLPFDRTWTEPAAGLIPSPNGILPPGENRTGDNIFAISRIDVMNQNNTLTNWLQADVSSNFFTDFQKTVPFASTYQPQVYDLIGSTKIEVRPAIGQNVQLNMFYILRPRRMKYLISRIPLTSFPSQRYIFCRSLSDVLDSLYEDEAADRWAGKAKEELAAITLSILSESWFKNNTVQQYIR